jgi:glycerophosphoryl diester phosphodiesterase
MMTTTTGTRTTASPVYVVGHRGCLYQELENTRRGFVECATMGCDAVELDVFLLRCDTLVVFHGGGPDTHPGDLYEYCGIEGNILDYTYLEAADQLSFNPTYAEFPCPIESIRNGSIPTLQVVLEDAKRSGLHVKIELKGPDVVQPVLELVDRLDMVDQCSFSSFDLDRLRLLRQLKPQRREVDESGGSDSDGGYLYRTGALFNDLGNDHDQSIPIDCIARATAVGASEIHLRYDTCSKGLIDQIHSSGLGTMAWFRGPIGMSKDTKNKYWDVGNEDEAMYEAVLRTGVQQMCINRPDVLLRLVNRIQRK